MAGSGAAGRGRGLTVRGLDGDLDLVERSPLLVDRPHQQMVGEHVDVEEVQHRPRDLGEPLLAGPSREPAGAADDVGHTVDRPAALVVVVVAREHELHTFAGEHRRVAIAHLEVGALVAGRVRRLVDRHDRPRLGRLVEGALEERHLLAIPKRVGVETDQSHVADRVGPPLPRHAQGGDLLVPPPSGDVVVAEDRVEDRASVEQVAERAEDGVRQPLGVTARVDVVAEQQERVVRRIPSLEHRHRARRVPFLLLALADVTHRCDADVGSPTGGERNDRRRRGWRALAVGRQRDDLAAVVEADRGGRPDEDHDDPEPPGTS